MVEPVRLPIVQEDLQLLTTLAESLAEDMLAELDARYSSRADQPAQERRYRRDAQDARDLLELLSRLRHEFPDLRRSPTSKGA